MCYIFINDVDKRAKTSCPLTKSFLTGSKTLITLDNLLLSCVFGKTDFELVKESHIGEGEWQGMEAMADG